MSRHLWGLVQDVKWKNNVMTDIQVVNIEENLKIKGVISRMQNFSREKCTRNGWCNNAWKGFRFVQSNSMLSVSHWDLKKYYSWILVIHWKQQAFALTCLRFSTKNSINVIIIIANSKKWRQLHCLWNVYAKHRIPRHLEVCFCTR